MRANFFALLVAVTFVMDITGRSVVSEPHTATSDLVHSLSEVRNGVAITRLLRSYDTATEDDEERAGLFVSAVEKAKTIFTATEVSDKTLKSWLNKGKSLDDVFTRMRLTQAGDKIFENPQFFTWLKYADDLSTTKPEKATYVVATLTTHYGDEGLLRILQAAQKSNVEKIKDVATTLEKAQIQGWLVGGKSVDDVFSLLKLDKAGAEVFTNPMYTTWNTYMKIFNAENPTKRASLYRVLRADYSDDTLSKIFEAGKSHKYDKRFQKAGGQLDKAGGDLLSSPQLNTFTNYMKSFNKENPDKQTTLIATVSHSYGDNGAVKLLESAKKVPSTKAMATDLETAQIKHWLSSDKDPETLFKALSLDKAGDNLLSTPQFATFIKYTDEFHAKNLDKKMTTMWTIRTYYDDVDVAKMIMAAEKVLSTQNVAKRMEGELFKSWMAPPNNPDDVFNSLKLDTAGEALFANPMFSFWIKFLDDYNKVVPGKNNPRLILTKTYDDKALIKMINAAKRNRKTKTLVNKLETEMLTEFLYAEKQPIDVAKLLKVREKTDPNWKLWKQYLKDFNKVYLMGITT